jgi:sodium transport system permease protein
MNSLIVARKELVDHLRDGRALASTGLYALMGPVIVWLVILVSAEPTAAAGGGTDGASGGAAMTMIASVFTLLSVFSGGQSVAIDLIAGERERRSLLPLLLNSVSRSEIIVGKWLATSVFATASALSTLLAFALVFAISPAMPSISMPALMLIPSLVFLALLAAAVEVLVSTWCRNVKEANTYLTILIFVVMGLGMWLAFSPGTARAWWFLVPIAGHQHLLQAGLTSAESIVAGSIVLAAASVGVAALALAYAGRLFQRDAILYGE